jgi:uncharacterized protein
MKVGLEKTFPMPAGPDTVWSCLQNIEGVARCMPGAKITEQVDATHYRGTIAVRVGPASMSFKGEIEVLELDAEPRMLHLVGKGSDAGGTSGASMDLVARIVGDPTARECQLSGKSEVTLSGKAAAFGGRMMGTVADQILGQFAANFAKQVGAAVETAASAVSADRAATTAATPGATVAPIAATTPAAVAPAAVAPEPANEINGLGLLWAVIRSWFRGLFGRRKPV